MLSAPACEDESSVKGRDFESAGRQSPAQIRFKLYVPRIIVNRFIKLTCVITNVISELADQFNQFSVKFKTIRSLVSSRKGSFLVSSNGPKKNWREGEARRQPDCVNAITVE